MDADDWLTQKFNETFKKQKSYQENHQEDHQEGQEIKRSPAVMHAQQQ